MKRGLSLHEKAFKALKEAVRGAILEHKRTGRPIAIWRHERVVWISADEALREWYKKNRSVVHGVVKRQSGQKGYPQRGRKLPGEVTHENGI